MTDGNRRGGWSNVESETEREREREREEIGGERGERGGERESFEGVIVRIAIKKSPSRK